MPRIFSELEKRILHFGFFLILSITRDQVVFRPLHTDSFQTSLGSTGKALVIQTVSRLRYIGTYCDRDG